MRDRSITTGMCETLAPCSVPRVKQGAMKLIFLFVSLEVRFPMPGFAEDPLADTPWYSFDFGPIHFTMMSTEHDFTPGSMQVRYGIETLHEMFFRNRVLS